VKRSIADRSKGALHFLESLVEKGFLIGLVRNSKLPAQLFYDDYCVPLGMSNAADLTKRYFQILFSSTQHDPFF
jgi:hypothetical protein